MNRDEIHIIARNSNWSAQDINRALVEKVYPGSRNWKDFVKWTCLALGAGLFLAGVVFFFAYNWQYLHKFVKIGLILCTIILLTGLAIIPAWEITLRKTLLTAASVITGVLFAVFGQVYQTGANAYDFFLAWLVFTVVWVVVTKFHVLWLLFTILLNTTWFLYMQQVATTEAAGFRLEGAAVINLLLFASIKARPFFFTGNSKAPNWFAYPVAVTAAFLSVLSLTVSIYDTGSALRLTIPAIIAVVAAVYLFGLGMKSRNVFYLVIVGLSTLFTGVALINRNFQGSEKYALILGSLFVLITLYAMTFLLFRLVKKWQNEGLQNS